METHNATIYHCVTCGRVVHVELEAKPPDCCGHTMAKAFTETIHEGDVDGEGTGGPTETAPPVNKGRAKPK